MARLRGTAAGKLVIPVPDFWARLSRRRRIPILAALLLAVLLAALRLGFGPVSEEERVKSAVLEAIQAAENESVAELAPTISRNYRGVYGVDHGDLIARAERDFSLISSLSIQPVAWDIQLEGDGATVDLQFRFHLIYDKIGPYSNVPVNRLPATPRGEDNKARLILEREDGQWRIVEIEVEIPAH